MTMAAYVRLRSGLIRRDDGAVIPADLSNADFRAFAAWEAAGGVADVEPAPAPSRVLTGAAFLARFTAEEVSALWSADPRLMAGALKVAAQDSANLDSPDASALLQLAVAKGVLSPERMAAILA